MPITRRALVASLPGLALAAAARRGRAQDIRYFRIGTGTTGGTYFPIGGILAGAISGPPGLPACDDGGSCGVPGLIAVAQATGGSIDNVLRIRDGDLDSALCQADVAFAALSGTGPFESKGPVAILRAIAHLYAEFVHVVVAADSGIETVADLRGRHLSLGDAGSGTMYDALLILDAYGIALEDVDAVYERPEPSADLLVAGELDAFVIVGGPPLAIVTDAARRSAIRLLPFDDEITRKLVAGAPFFTLGELAADTYPGVPPTKSLEVGALWVVAATVEDELVYEITRALWEPATAELLAAGHPRGAEITLANALRGLGIPLHPGAERYYQENGMGEAPE